MDWIVEQKFGERRLTGTMFIWLKEFARIVRRAVHAADSGDEVDLILIPTTTRQILVADIEQSRRRARKV